MMTLPHRCFRYSLALLLTDLGRRDSSGEVAAGVKLSNTGIGVRFRAKEGGYYIFYSNQIGSGVQRASYTINTCFLFCE